MTTGIHSTCTQEFVHERCIHVYMKCLQKTPVRTSLLSTNFDLLWFIIYFNNPQIGHNIISSLDLAWFFKIKCIYKCVDTVLYASDIRSVPCQTAALHELWWRAIFSLHMLYSVVHCIYTVYICIYIYTVYTIYTSGSQPFSSRDPF